MLMNQAKIFGRRFRDDAGDDGDKGGGGADDGKGGNDAAAELQKQLDAMKTDNERLQAKISEANKHTKEAERVAEEAARKKAEADGNFEQLFTSSEKARKELETRLEEQGIRIATKEKSAAAMKIAVEIADGPNAEILADFIGRRLKYTDEGIKVIDDSGNLTISSISDLTKEFAGSSRFASLVKGSQSSGGGANGGSKGGGASKVIPRADFEALDPASRMKFVKDGGKVTDT